MMYERPLTCEMYMTSRWISDSCLFDNCLETDGALACVIVSAERARDCRQRPVYVHSAAQGLPAQHHGMVNYWERRPAHGARPDRRPASVERRPLHRRRRRGPDDHAFTPLIPLSLGGLRLLRTR